jgi:SAM-dependent methyltransferase
MREISKICDAADWFDPEFQSVVENELRETARFHRKQWEFAMIFLTLKKLGFVRDDKIGLSLGGGNERVLYSIANHVKKLYVTDLYDENTTWDCARTVDPDEFIKLSKPFNYDENKIKALRMDMRKLDFEDNTFDFCYSSCAVEHIGDFEDFINHFNEVYRCLKNDGVYVFTTEISFSDVTIKDPNNYIFSSAYLNRIIEQIRLTPESDPYIAISGHSANLPFPSNISNLCYENGKTLSENLLKKFPHLTLIRGKYPFTSIQLVLRKQVENRTKSQVIFNSFDSTSNYLNEGVQSFKESINTTEISINPFSSLPDGLSHFYQDHANYFQNNNVKLHNSDTVFHTDYFWFGDGRRNFKIRMKFYDTEEQHLLQLRIHRYPVLDSQSVDSVYEEDFLIDGNNAIEKVITLTTDDDYSYAILGKSLSENLKVKSISLKSTIANIKENVQINQGELRTNEVIN